MVVNLVESKEYRWVGMTVENLAVRMVACLVVMMAGKKVEQ